MWTVTFKANGISKSFDMYGTRKGAIAWAKRERHYFASGVIARYSVKPAAPVAEAA